MERALITWIISVKDKGMMTLGSCPAKHRALINDYIRRDILKTQLIKGREYVSIVDTEVVDAWIANAVLAADPLLTTRANSIMLNKDSKAGKALDYLFLQIRSVDPDAHMYVNDERVNIGAATGICGCASLFSEGGKHPHLDFRSPVYLIENIECWANAEKYLPREGIFIFYQGWISNKLLAQIKNWKTVGLHISPDYDLVGLHNWVRLNKEIPGAKLFFPPEFERLIAAYASDRLWLKQANYLPVAADLCSQVNDPTLTLWLTQMRERGACLEQEALLIEPRGSDIINQKD
jgi:hypothetical protein